jgi:hypothetical protein
VNRCVLVVGLPFPNIGDVVLQEKKRYIKSYLGEKAKVSKELAAKFSKRAEEYFEDICMNSLNQAIGFSFCFPCSFSHPYPHQVVRCDTVTIILSSFLQTKDINDIL